MAIHNKLIRNWERIFLDTSIICCLFNSEKTTSTDDTIQFVRKLIDYLNNYKSENSKDRTFIISTITLTELLVKENDGEKIKRILKVLNSNNVEFVDFDLEIALRFNAVLYPHLAKPKLHEFAREFGFKSGDFAMAREWIQRDFMILMTAIQNGVDAILTTDKRTFYPLSQKLNEPCVLCYPNLFKIEGNIMMGYYNEKVDDFINNAKK